MADLHEGKLKTNLDTNFLKLIAVVSMVIDHVGGAFFPEQAVLRAIGRLAFPLFCYCMTVGLLYTHDIRKYLIRLGVFAILSQPFYVFAFHPHDFIENLLQFNIFFTLFLSLLSLWGFKEKKWWLFALALFALCWWNFDYSGNGVILMLIFYCCRNRPKLGAVLYALFWLPALLPAEAGWGTITLLGWTFKWQAFAILALPLIYCCTRVHPKIHKYFYYAVYPVHLAAIGLVQLVLAAR